MKDSFREKTVLTLAMRGAEIRLEELKKELEEIYRAFPGLRKGATRPASSRRSAPIAHIAKARRHPKWTKAMKQAAAQRMRKYWASQAAKNRP